MRLVAAPSAAGGWQPGLKPWEVTPTRMLSWRDRIAIRFGRAVRWEFWPSWLYYVPIAVWIVALGIRHRMPMAFTAANPALDAGGVVGERKHTVLGPLQDNAPDLVATFERLPEESTQARIRVAERFAALHGYPVVLKPNVGQRGRGVLVVRNADEVRGYLERHRGDAIVQRHVGGSEFGVFIARVPGEPVVRVLSIVHKTFPEVVGDGVRNLRELILGDGRARLIAEALLSRWARDLLRVPAAGETIKLVEIGAHSRGSVFLDATAEATPALAAALTRLVDAVPGYAFGRLDLRVPDLENFRLGQGLQVLELNGVSAESAHIYHPGTPLLDGYRAMFRQWALAFAIGAAHARHGAHVTSLRELLRLYREDQRIGATWF